MLAHDWTRTDTLFVLGVILVLVPSFALAIRFNARTAPGRPAPAPSPRAGRRPNQRAADFRPRRRSQFPH